MFQEVDAISPKWIGEIVSGKRNNMTLDEKRSLNNLVVTIETVSCREAFNVYNEIMNSSFMVGDSFNTSKFQLDEMIYVGPDAAQFSIACKLCVAMGI